MALTASSSSLPIWMKFDTHQTALRLIIFLMMPIFELAMVSLLSVGRAYEQQNQTETDLVYQRLYSLLFDDYNSMLPSVFTKRFLTESMTNYRWSHNGAYEHVPKASTAIEILMMTVIDVDDSNQLIRSVLEYRLRWNDPRLTWDPSLFMDINHIYAPAEKVWTPAIFAENIMQTEPVACHDTFPDNVIVSCNGDILRVFTLSVLFTCTIKAGKFPFDTQSCSLDFAEYLMDPSETDLSMFIVEDAIFKVFLEKRQRLSPYYVTLMIIPIQIITNISVFALFWITEAGLIDQTVVTLSSLISLLVLTDIMDKSVPKTSDIPNSENYAITFALHVQNV
ncbi:hypothetical protein ANCCEY_03639 [Ancylostoma ceylanicum]|uniref:Neurotransmitter-gated ion-channel ligand-binding domain-containing protein n=1 Tax=Ancylostoma ceylanicum TaxID=53326 RepID=A0A0D6M1E5_9BILA|nr:hypothetical protein ANCCEY_03639 [Ancylostoma ceylanicum]